MTVRVVRYAVLGLALSLSQVAANAQSGIRDREPGASPVVVKVTRGESARVFGVDVDSSRPVTIAGVEEVRQQNPPSHFAVSATNHSDTPIDSYVIAAAIVTADGDVRTVQPLPAVKNLKPGQTRRQQTPLRTVIISESERVAFLPYKITVAGQEWAVPEADMRAAVKKMAQQVPLP